MNRIGERNAENFKNDKETNVLPLGKLQVKEK